MTVTSWFCIRIGQNIDPENFTLADKRKKKEEILRVNTYHKFSFNIRKKFFKIVSKHKLRLFFYFY